MLRRELCRRCFLIVFFFFGLEFVLGVVYGFVVVLVLVWDALLELKQLLDMEGAYHDELSSTRIWEARQLYASWRPRPCLWLFSVVLECRKVHRICRGRKAFSRPRFQRTAQGPIPDVFSEAERFSYSTSAFGLLTYSSSPSPASASPASISISNVRLRRRRRLRRRQVSLDHHLFATRLTNALQR